DDPTVIELERAAAEILSKPAAVYMPSGTMANQVAIRAHSEPGDEVLMDAEGHSYFYESGAAAAIAGVTCRLLPGVRGIFTPEDVRAALRPRNVHFPRTRLVCVENTHNRGGGSVWTIEQVRAVCETARQAGLATHLDGARLWNAAVATGTPESDYARCFDSVSVCFSKGLGAPVGSALAGSEEFIARARRFRKMFGGAMRQAGIIAAGALYALRHHRDRLAEDHANAAALAEGLAGMDGIELNPGHVQTNIIVFKVTKLPARELVDRLGARGVLVLALDESTIRAVTNLMVAAEDVPRALDAFRAALA
ncbi:MAG: aminotransferase class I/II-fold pyridoxal phosphate-dependent enzyme, partial [Planctomycetes bacterium]|nr:aminotransferase class I/II-fold pyridoxal phosphate-dependent enzyme [Planctomycetota bacterium]